ncbi:unnamed protein product [Victoria cruziana]
MFSTRSRRFPFIFLRHLSSASPSSSILNPQNLPFLTSKQKSRNALALLKSEEDPDRVVEIARAAFLSSESHLDRISLSIAVSKLAASRSFDTLHKFLEEQKNRPDCRDERFVNKVMILYGKSGMLRESIRTFEHMDKLGLRRTVRSLNALLSAAVASKNHKEVSRIFTEFPKAFSIKPDLDTYNTVIRSLCDSGNSISAYSILDEMDKNKVRPNEISYGTLMAGLYAEERFDEIATVLDLMTKKGCSPSLTTTNFRIKSLCKLGKSAEAKALLDGMRSRGILPDVFAFYNLIYGFCKEGNLEAAKAIFLEMGKKKNPAPSSECYFTLIYYLCEGGDFNCALDLCNKCMERGWVPNFTTVKSLVSGLAKNERVEEARGVVEKVKERFPGKVDMWTEVEEKLQ